MNMATYSEIYEFIIEKYHPVTYYRVTYNDIGIYDAFRNEVSNTVWKNFLNSENVKWLPKPPSYAQNNRSYFTERGYTEFQNRTLPEIIKYLDVCKIKVAKYQSIGNIIYRDKYQVVVDTLY